VAGKLVNTRTSDVIIDMRERLRRIREDLRRPLPGSENLSRRGRLLQRFRYLASRYGWRLVVVVVAYYLIRDLILYVLLPYLAVTQIFAH
jgi:hypothetical protein